MLKELTLDEVKQIGRIDGDVFDDEQEMFVEFDQIIFLDLLKRKIKFTTNDGLIWRGVISGICVDGFDVWIP